MDLRKDFLALRNLTAETVAKLNTQPLSVDYGNGTVVSATEQARASLNEMHRYLEFMCKIIVDQQTVSTRPREH